MDDVTMRIAAVLIVTCNKACNEQLCESLRIHTRCSVIGSLADDGAQHHVIA